jgi:F0F1-type ATP synthase membrane subunit b/b'
VTAASTPEPELSSMPGGVLDSARLGGHVNAVFRAAEEAAARIQDEAREAARKDAESLKAEAERLRSDAEGFTKKARAKAERYAADRRAKAEAEAEDILAQAEDEAEEILLEAERQAASFKQDAERRHQMLNQDLSLAEDRLRELASGLYELAERLDDLAGTPVEGDEEEPELAAEDDASLVDVLTPAAQAEEAPGAGRSSALG